MSEAPDNLNPQEPGGGAAAPAGQQAVDTIYWWLALVLLVVALFAVWTNHLGNGFHHDDAHMVTGNPVVKTGSVERALTSARWASALKEYSAWRPLTMLTFILDYAILGDNPALFHADSLLWFVWVLVFVYLLARLIPGASRYSALLASALVAFHPLSGDLLNYISHRFFLLRALGLTATLVLFAGWKRLPPAIWWELPRVPSSEWDVFMRRLRTIVVKAWKLLLSLPVPWFYLPLLLGLLSDPGTAVFPLLLVVWLRLFEPERGLRPVIAPGVLCGVWWVAHTSLTFSAGAAGRQPVLAWWAAQPWVYMQYLAGFFHPAGLRLDPSTAVFTEITAVAGFLGIAALSAVAYFAARRPELRSVSFGIAWFLITLLPEFLIPQRDGADYTRAFVPMIGLAIVSASLVWEAVRRFRQMELLLRPGIGVTAALAVYAVGTLGIQAHGRNKIWASENRYWAELLEREPSNPRALLHSGLQSIEGDDVDGGYERLLKARGLAPNDAEIEVALAQYAEAAGKTDGEQHFRRAVELAPSSPVIIAAYSDWLLIKERYKDANETANKALALDTYSGAARRAVVNVQLATRQWSEAQTFGSRSLELIPGDPDALRALNVASNALDEETAATKKANNDPTADNLLKLSVVHMQNGRFEEGIAACREALKIQPGLAEAWSNISVGYHMMGKTDESIAALREALKINPNLPNVKENLEVELEAKAAQEGRAGGDVLKR